ncbi:hypothetical protein Q5752_005811 [Cryptotrichosporon argae]
MPRDPRPRDKLSTLVHGTAYARPRSPPHHEHYHPARSSPRPLPPPPRYAPASSPSRPRAPAQLPPHRPHPPPQPQLELAHARPQLQHAPTSSAFALAPPIDLAAMSRRAAASSSRSRAPASLGIEDELSFGSDEDTLDAVGEIRMPAAPVPAANATKPAPPGDSKRAPGLRSSSSTSLIKSKPTKGSALETIKEKRRLRKESGASLASSTIVHTPPPPPVTVLELLETWEKGKRTSFMGGFRGLRRKNEGSQAGSAYSSSVNLSKTQSNSSYSPSIPLSPQSSRAPSSPAMPTLAPIRMSPFEAGQRLQHRASNASFSSAGTGADAVDLSFFPTPHNAVPTPPMSSASKMPPGHHDRSPSLASSAVTRPSTGTESYRTSSTSAGSGTGTGTGSSQRRGLDLALASAILPAYPAGLAALESIQVLYAAVEKRVESRVAGATPSNSPRSIFRVAPKWTPTTLVFTRFKLSLDDADVDGDSLLDDGERTVAHLHVFAPAPSTGSPASKKKSSLAGEDRVEVERRAVGRCTTAGVWNEAVDNRGSVLRVGFGDDKPGASDWLVQMRDGSQLHEWIRQIKKTATMIRAEDMGLGHAIRAAYENASVGADDLALKLAMHNTPQADITPRAIQPEALSPLDPHFVCLAISAEPERMLRATQSHDVRASHPFEYDFGPRTPDESGPPAGTDERLNALASLSGAALHRSRSVDQHAPARGARRTAAHRKSLSASIPSLPLSDADGSGSLLEYYYRSKGAAASVRSQSNLPRKPESEPPAATGAKGASVRKRASSTSYTSRHGVALPPAPPPPTVPLPPNPLEVTVDGAPAPARLALAPAAVLTPRARPAALPAAHAAAFGAGPVDAPTPSSATSAASTPSLQPDEKDRRGVRGALVPTSALGSGADSEVGSIAPSESSSTTRLRRLRAKPKAIDIMAEFSAQEAEWYAADVDEPKPVRVHEARDAPARRIRFAED